MYLSPFSFFFFFLWVHKCLSSLLPQLLFFIIFQTRNCFFFPLCLGMRAKSPRWQEEMKVLLVSSMKTNNKERFDDYREIGQHRKCHRGNWQRSVVVLNDGRRNHGERCWCHAGVRSLRDRLTFKFEEGWREFLSRIYYFLGWNMWRIRWVKFGLFHPFNQITLFIFIFLCL